MMRATHSDSNSSSRLSFRLALIIGIAASSLLSGYLFIIKATAQKPISAQLVSDDGTDHYLYAALYTTRESQNSTLVLNNPLDQMQSARVTLYNKHGQALVVPEISMAPNQNRYFNIADWLVGGNADDFSEGSLEIFFHGPPMGMGGQLVITDEHHSLSFDVPFAESEMFASAQLESLWWSLESQSKAEVFLANTKTERMTITPTFYINGEALASEPIILEPHESETLDIGRALQRLDVNASTIRGGITLRHNRPPGALAVAGAITSKQSGFSTTMRFLDARAQHSTKLYGAHLLIGKPGTQAGFAESTSFVPRVTVRNTTTQPVQIQGRVLYTTEDDSRSVEMAPLTLAANEVRALNMSAVISSVGTERLSDAGIEIEHTGRPGAIVAAIASVDQSKSRVFDTPLRDPDSPNFNGGSYPFRIDGDNRAVIHLKNIDPVTNGEPRLCEVHLRFEGVTYTLPAQRVEAGQTLAIDIRKLRDEQVPDGKGQVIPLNAMQGQVTWFNWGALGQFVGRLAQYNPVLGTASSFSCPQPCKCNEDVNTTVPNSTFIKPSPINGFPGESFELSAWEKRGHCGVVEEVEIEGVTFKTSNSAVVSIDGDIATLGIVAGAAKISAKWTTSVYTGTSGGCPVEFAPGILPPECDPVECDYLDVPFGGKGESPVTNIRIDITQDGTRITNSTRNVIVGQEISLATQVAPATTVIKDQRWTVPGNRIADYETVFFHSDPAHTTGMDKPLTNLTSSAVDFYWVDGGEGRQVTFSGIANGRSFTRKAIFNVKRPTAQVTITTGAIAVDNIALLLRYGDSQRPGISFSSDISQPAGFTGRAEWVQIAMPLRRRKLNNGIWQKWTGAGLDRQYPYWIGDSTNDSPDTPLENAYLEKTVEDSFEMWLMYRPDIEGAIPVPLKKVTWGWSAAAARQGINSWVLRSSSKTVSPPADTTAFPKWSRNSTSNAWVNEN